jgi:hypothetical protein
LIHLQTIANKRTEGLWHSSLKDHGNVGVYQSLVVDALVRLIRGRKKK